MELVEILGEELHSQVIAKLGDKKLLIDDGKLIPAYRLDEVTGKNKTLSEQIEKAHADLKELKKAAGGNEELVKKIADLQAANKAAAELAEKNGLLLKKSLAIKEQLMDAGVFDPEARELLLPKFDLNSVELDEAGKIKDFDTKLKPIKDNKILSQLFGEIKMQGNNMKGGGGGGEDFYTKDQVEKMSQAEVDANYPTIVKSMERW